MKKHRKTLFTLLVVLSMLFTLGVGVSAVYANTDEFNVNSVVKEDADGDGQYTLTIDTSGAGVYAYIAVKQSTSMMVWTQTELTSEQQVELCDAIKAADRSTYAIRGFCFGEDTFVMGNIINDDGDQYKGEYTFTVDGDNAALICDYDRISHAVYGTYTIPVQNTSFILTFEPGSASHICYLYVDEATDEVIYDHKVDFDDDDFSAEIEARDGYISVVFIKQAQSGMIWASEEVSKEIMNEIVASVQNNDKAYKGHDAVVFGEGEHDLTYAIGNGKKAKNKTVTYTFIAE